MTWIALKMLTGDRAKFLGIVMGLTFAALLIAQQGSIFCGLMLRTSAQISDVSGADLWVMDGTVRFIDDVKPMQESQLHRIRGVDGVAWAVPFYKGIGRAKLTTRDPDGKRRDVIEQVILLGLDDASMVGAPRHLFVGSLADLRRPDAVIVDKVGLEKLYPGQGGEAAEDPADLAKFLGRELEMNDRRTVIVGICEASRTFQTYPVVYTLYSRAKRLIPQERKVLTYVLAKAEPGLASDEVAGRIARRTGLGAKTSEQFTRMTIDYYMKYTGIPINFGITVVLGFLVGTAIAGQTFYNFTVENLRQFGALKAMGTTNRQIVGMILIQAGVVGLLGFGLGLGLASLFGLVVEGTELAWFTPWQLLPISGGSVLLICILSSLVCVRRVVVLEPAVVFRG